MAWTLQLALDPASRVPLTAQLADALVASIRAGRLAPTQRLPGTRALAGSLGVSRNTVVTAYEELEAQGWLRMARGSGAYVCDDLPTVASTPRGRQWSTVGFELKSKLDQGAASARRDWKLAWDWGVPDVRIAPIAELGRAYRRALSPLTLDYKGIDRRYGSPLEEQLAKMLSLTRGSSVPAANVLTTRGSLMALYLVARVIVEPGDVVAVEEPGYWDAWRQFELAGARVVPLPVDAEGLEVAALRKLAARRPVRAVFVTPHHQFPTTVTLAATRRLELLQFAKEKRVAIIEDDCDHEFHYDGRPVPPLLHADSAGSVVYVGSLSKILAPGLRLGYAVGPAELIAELARLRRLIDLEGDKPLETAIAELFEDGIIERHYNRSRRTYRARRDLLADMLQRRLGDVLEFASPHGGMAIWAGVAPDVDVETWAARAQARGLFFRTGQAFYFDQEPRPFVRLGFARLDESELETAVEEMVRALPPASRSRGCASARATRRRPRHGQTYPR